MGVSCTRRFQRPQATVLPMCVPKLSKEASLRERKFHHTHARRPPTVTLTWCGAHRLTPTSAHAGGGTLHSTAYRRGPDSVVEHVLCGVLLAPIERHAGQGDARAQAGVVESPLHSTATALPVYQYSLSAGPPLCDHTTVHCTASGEQFINIWRPFKCTCACFNRCVPCVTSCWRCWT